MPDKSAAQLLDILLAKLKCDGSNPNVALVRNWVEVVGRYSLAQKSLTLRVAH